MSNFKLNLPTDIPWKRKCVSEDMMDVHLCDKKSPSRWRSSIAIFEYEPDEENQQYEGMTICYLKVVCSLTGYQEDPKEIGLNPRGLRDFWDDQPGIENYEDVLQKYYACYGAILEVSVGPSAKNTPLDNYPYFIDFEPKKRELYQLASSTNEIQSRSIESLNITKSAGNTQSLEILDIDMGGGGHSQQASFFGTGGGYSVQNPNGQWGTRRINADESLSSRSTDVGQEKRETFSFTTQISQLYHQLDSYHLGTNRAMFFMLPRPHTLESEHTFVNGLRNIEGIQEFFLIVTRPKDTGDFCVEAYLETGHIGKNPRWEMEEIPGTELETSWTGAYQARPKGDDDETTVYDEGDRQWDVATDYPGYQIKNAVFTTPGGQIRYNYDLPNLVDVHPHISEKNKDFIRVSGKVHSGFANHTVGKDRWEEIYYPFTVNITLAKYKPVSKTTDTLFITGRNLCCCDKYKEYKSRDLGVVYEKPLSWKSIDISAHGRSGSGITIIAANQMRHEFEAAFQKSRTDVANRYDTPIRLHHTDFALSALLSEVDTSKVKLKDLTNISHSLSSKLCHLHQEITLNELLTMPFGIQKELFSMTNDEIMELRNALTGINHKASDVRKSMFSKQNWSLTHLFHKKTDDDSIS